MPHPVDGYWLDGKRIPSASTIPGRFKDSGGLIHWAFNIPFTGLCEARSLIGKLLAGENCQEEASAFMLKPLSSWDYRTKRDEAADAGTIAHEMVDCYVHAREFDMAAYKPELIEKARPAYEAFLTWARQSRFTIVETEVQLISKQYRFGGTRDAILIDGKRALCDWKTSNSIYPEMLCQLAAYGILDEEAGNRIDGGYHLLRFSKQENPDDPVHFSHHYWSQLDKAKAAFLLMRQLYDLMSDLKKLVK